jgi:hypothetical protein
LPGSIGEDIRRQLAVGDRIEAIVSGAGPHSDKIAAWRSTVEIRRLIPRAYRRCEWLSSEKESIDSAG